MIPMNKRIAPTIGTKVGDRIVLDSGEKYAAGYRHRVRCSCGRISLVYRSCLVSGGSLKCKSCSNSDNARRHGHASDPNRSPEYRTWQSMVQRCRNPNGPDYHRYGGRGINMCGRWASFENFLLDMGHRPDGTTLNRVDNDIGYNKENCRWSTHREQYNNKCSNRIIEYRSRRATMAQWARIRKIKYSVLFQRIHRGWTVRRALGYE